MAGVTARGGCRGGKLPPAELGAAVRHCELSAGPGARVDDLAAVALVDRGDHLGGVLAGGAPPAFRGGLWRDREGGREGGRKGGEGREGRRERELFTCAG